jgi:hypothetical protein
MSITRSAVERSPSPRTSHPLGRRPGRILIGLLAIAAGSAALLPASSGAGAPAKGAHKLVFKINGQARQDVVAAGGIVFKAECPAEACTVVASAVGESPSVHTAKVRARVAGGGSERLMLPLGARDDEKLRAALAAGKKPALTVSAIARDAYGSKVPLELTVTALRG